VAAEVVFSSVILSEEKIDAFAGIIDTAGEYTGPFGKLRAGSSLR
jgi:hypothetical protein